MITFDEAAGCIADIARPLGKESVSLERAAGRVLALDVTAMIDSPRADCSTMDGYAVRQADLPGTLRVVGESYPGGGFAHPLEPGCAVRIFTGAPVPSGADRIVIQECVEREGEGVTVPRLPEGPHHVRGLGSDFRVGADMLPKGSILNPRSLVAAAAADVAEVEVWRQPRVAILSTGDELAPPGTARDRPSTIPESVSYGVAALVEQWGGVTIGIRRLRDDLAAMEAAAAEALRNADVVVVTGGASVGERDFAKRMFQRQEMELVFTKVAMKPGKPVWIGRAGNRLVLGLPGNPTSAMVTARLLLVPLIAGLTGRPPTLDWYEIVLASPLAAGGDREEFVRARRTESGAIPADNQDSGAQLTLAEADLLLRRPKGDRAKHVGELVQALRF
ncbi:molybdopterin molybdotransferase MoeA [Tsuneonella sp. HG249]